jgi:hypothetical protein
LNVIVVVAFFSKCLLGGLAIFMMADNKEQRFRTVPNRKQNFTHTLCSLLSAIIKIVKLPSRHLEKKATTTITLNLD